MWQSRIRAIARAGLALALLIAGTNRLSLSQPVPAQSAPAREADFRKDVEPVLLASCKVCHMGSNPPAKLRLDSPAGILAGSQSGRVIVPGKPSESLLVQRVSQKTMPPGKPLPDAEIALITAWVEQGAKMPAGELPAASAGKPVLKIPQQAMLNQYCAECHSDMRRMFDRLDTAGVAKDAEQWELVVRKLRAGMMPPSGAPRPDAAKLEGLVSWLETELDKQKLTRLPPPGLHRLNRTEYANAVRDLLALEIDPAKFLPSDDSTRGFDNIAGALTLSPALLEGYTVAAA
jgi:mono/diheme cytochrome c family protein